MKRVFCAALTLLAAANFTACKKVRKCETGSDGCLGGAPVDGECEAGLVARDGECVAEDAPPDEDCPAGLVERSGECVDPGEPADCECEGAEVCAPDGETCIDYCAPTDELPSQGELYPAIYCDDDPATFESICMRRCELRCRQQEQFCPDFDGCDACDDEALEACEDECGDSADPESCLFRSCNDVLSQGCSASIECAGGESPDCAGVRCENTCALDGESYAFDGICDDGDFETALSGACDYGTDCADCGPRRGTPRPVQPLGGVCSFDSGCEGSRFLPDGRTDLARTETWCVAPDAEGAGAPRCIPDCSHGQLCPVGTECLQLYTDIDGVQELIEDDEGRVAAACFPLECE